jgi:hypothetical protein
MDKEHILQEIRRTAWSNGGTPLGWRRFSAETGIKESDWLGPHWARWSEAVREAGLSPNRMTAPYDEQDLLARYAGLARELGRLPTEGDMRRKTRSDPKFPTDRPFRRLGTKPQIIKRLLEYCQSHPDLDAVARMCKGYVPRNHRQPATPIRDTSQLGFVYLVKSGRFYKIGKTNAVGRREYELGLQLPEKLQAIHRIQTDDPSGIEAYWHNRFKAKRKNGEWFQLGAADVAAFKRRKFM